MITKKKMSLVRMASGPKRAPNVTADRSPTPMADHIATSVWRLNIITAYAETPKKLACPTEANPRYPSNRFTDMARIASSKALDIKFT
jgi:hypothetical protein